MSSFHFLLKNATNIKVLDASIDLKDYASLDLSVKNDELANLNLDNPIDFENFIENWLKKNNAKVGYGGYCEKRNLYKNSIIFKNEISEERNIHIGLDLWIKAGTKVLAALDGKIHSFKFNEGIGNYGPTIVLEHNIENEIFYTLYGHLSTESIENIEIGTFLKKGQQIAILGNSAENGNYSPHLHFQIIKNIENYSGDYPGVCSAKKLSFYLENCPNPASLLNLEQ